MIGSWRGAGWGSLPLLCAALAATSFVPPGTAGGAPGTFVSQLFDAVREASSGAALCGLGSTPLLTSTVRSLLDCSNQCVGLVSGGGNCCAFSYWKNNATCQMFAGWPICFDVQPYCTLYQVRELRAVLQTLGPSRHTIQGPV